MRKPVKGVTSVTKTENAPTLGFVKITHHQTIRQSLDYNSAEASYGVELYCPDNPSDIDEAVVRAETTVERCLSDKITEHRGDLEAISAGELAE